MSGHAVLSPTIVSSKRPASIQLDVDFKALTRDIERLLGRWKPRSADERHAKVRASLWLQRLRAFQCGRQVSLQQTRNDYALLLKQGCVTGHFLAPLDKAPSKEDLTPLQRHVVWSLRRWEKVEALLDPAGRRKTALNIMARHENFACDTEGVIDRFLERINRQPSFSRLGRETTKRDLSQSGKEDDSSQQRPAQREGTPRKRRQDAALRGVVEENLLLRGQLRDAHHRIFILERQLQRCTSERPRVTSQPADSPTLVKSVLHESSDFERPLPVHRPEEKTVVDSGTPKTDIIFKR
ncbi:hypothetical protein FOZ63_027044 [Perkinsus olseni]|uniref:DUF4485 domain-containing protein n=1 Tax=Perkinsus olseni TaxID=32597 RepID=A0A7J6RF75_PEROL|nr:hypothetical protein FOZ63_027044 [Perkinsus olseni]KAF4743518.1 hypothetical protein FOZ62_020780 [Perkinsus olseni]